MRHTLIIRCSQNGYKWYVAPGEQQRLAGTAPRAVDAARGLGTQRLRAGLTSVAPRRRSRDAQTAPTALGLGPETSQRRPTLQEAKGWGTRKFKGARRKGTRRGRAVWAS